MFLEKSSKTKGTDRLMVPSMRSGPVSYHKHDVFPNLGRKSWISLWSTRCLLKCIERRILRSKVICYHGLWRYAHRIHWEWQTAHIWLDGSGQSVLRIWCYLAVEDGLAQLERYQAPGLWDLTRFDGAFWFSPSFFLLFSLPKLHWLLWYRVFVYTIKHISSFWAHSDASTRNLLMISIS